MKISEAIPLYLKYLTVLARSPYTITNARNILKRFIHYLEGEHLYDIEDLNREVMDDYAQEQAFSLTAKGKPFSIRYQVKTLGTIKGFTRFLKEKDYLVFDPSSGLKLPKEPKRLPKVILDRSEIKRLLKAPDMRTKKGYRDRVILEILYDTALRRSEIAGIRLSDLDLTAGFIRVIGKGNKERVVPLSQRVCELVSNYVTGVRPSYVRGKDTGYLWLNHKGDPLHMHAVYMMIKRYAKLAGVRKNISTHTFRHTCATHMLKNGAPIRHLQEMLGHESLVSTQIYTRVTINDLKQIHAKYHPGEEME